jgi:hypothetical protein
MFQSWRLKVREAEEALRNGRLEEAGRLLAEPGLLDFLPAQQLMAKVAREMAHRAQTRFAAGATMAGWHDLEAAQRLGAEDAAVAKVRQQFLECGLVEAESYLKAGDPAAAVFRLEALEHQGACGREFRLVREAATKVLSAQRLCQEGQFAQAEEELRKALALRPRWQVLEEIRQACAARGAKTRKLIENLHAALAREDWTMALTESEAILEICPEYEPAFDARRRAWAVVGTRLAEVPAAVCAVNGRAPCERAMEPMQSRQDADVPTSNGNPASRFMLWVDGVGGYLVCQGEVVSLGQPVQGSYVDVPVLGDISRLHARIRRDGESYLIEPVRQTRVNGRPVDQVTLLADGNEIELGDGVRVHFRLPSALSRTARLDFASRHRTQPRADGVLLMAESCILGPGSGSHVVCRDWPQEVVLFSQGGNLHCRALGHFQVDGVEAEERSPIARSSQIVGESFSLSLENV